MSYGARLALGTAQLGQRYGVANRLGAPSLVEARAIVELAREAGVDCIDTAISYGNSEEILGSIGIGGLRVITKLPPLDAHDGDVGAWVHRAVAGSLQRLGTSSVAALLLHRPADALGPHAGELLGALRELRAAGVTQRIGISIYDPAELDALMPRMSPDFVQAPFNVLDRRLLHSGWLERLHRSGVEVHVRSAFLQGLLLMSERQLPPQFAAWRPLWTRWHAWLQEHETTPLHAALGFVLRTPGVDRAVVGVEAASQLREILAHLQPLEMDVPLDLASNDLELIDPTRWKKP